MKFSHRLVGGLLSACALASPVLAHPHVWIESTTAIGFDDAGLINAMGIAWTFDEFYSLAAVDGLDKNKDGKYDAAELKELGSTYLVNLSKYQYFTVLELNGKSFAAGKAEKPIATFDKGRLTFAFRLPLSKSVDPKSNTLSFSSFDPTYYIDIQPAKAGGVQFGSKAPKSCNYKSRQSNGPTPPMALNLSQSLKQTLPPDGVFGMLPSTIIDVRCGASTAL